MSVIGALRQARRAASLTQADVGNRVGYHRESIQRWETNGQSPRLDALEAWATVLGLEVHVGPAEALAPLLARSMADLDAHIERRAKELSAQRVAEIVKNADARADARLRADRDYWRGVALKALGKTTTTAA